jgi:uncharacterized membrane protein
VRLTAAAALFALIVLCVAWEMWLAPLRPGGSLMALKALPLAFPVAGVLRGKRYTFQWSSMLILAYFAEGATRAWSDTGISQKMAFLEVILSLVYFVAVVSYARGTKARRHP